MNSIDYITLEVEDPAAAERFYEAAFGLGGQVRLQSSDAPSAGFRGFTLSLIVAQPSTVRTLVDSAVAAGAGSVKPAEKSLWGFGGVVQAPDGTIWQVATSAKKDIGPDNRQIDEVVLLLGAEDIGASKRFYVDRGLTVGKGFGNYVDFTMPSSAVGLGLYKRRGLAKVAGVAPDGSGSHRLVIHSGAESFTDPDGFVWAPA